MTNELPSFKTLAIYLLNIDLTIYAREINFIVIHCGVFHNAGICF